MWGLDRIIASIDARERANSAKQFEAQARKQGGKPSVRGNTNKAQVRIRKK